MIAKQAEIRANIKKYFDSAYEGEPVIVPRKMGKNVVIISEEEYNRLSGSKHLSEYAKKLDPVVRVRKQAGKTPTGNVRMHNYEKLKVIRGLKDNWNGNGASPFSKKFLDKVEELLNELGIQPEIFPTAMGSIQLEYDNSRRDHMEIEIDESDTAEVFIVNFNGEEILESIPCTSEAINERAGDFYG